MRKEKKGKEKDYVEIELELPMWMIKKVEEKHIDLSKVLTEEIEKLDREERERERKEKEKEKKS